MFVACRCHGCTAVSVAVAVAVGVANPVGDAVAHAVAHTVTHTVAHAVSVAVSNACTVADALPVQFSVWEPLSLPNAVSDAVRVAFAAAIRRGAAVQPWPGNGGLHSGPVALRRRHLYVQRAQGPCVPRRRLPPHHRRRSSSVCDGATLRGASLGHAPPCVFGTHQRVVFGGHAAVRNTRWCGVLFVGLAPALGDVLFDKCKRPGR